MIVPVTVKDVFQTNCYFVIDEATKHGFLIDCGAEGDLLVDMIIENGWTIEKILLTHGHFDHTGGVKALQRYLDIPVMASSNTYLQDTYLNLSAQYKRDIVIDNAQFVKDGDTIALAANPEFKLQVLSTPGHTPDSVVYYCEREQAAFVGDTIFKNEPGLTCFPGGNVRQLGASIGKILSLPSTTRLLSGHSELTTVEHERKNYYR